MFRKPKWAIYPKRSTIPFFSVSNFYPGVLEPILIQLPAASIVKALSRSFRDREHQIMVCSKIMLNSYRRSWSAKQSVPLQIYPKKWWLIINCYYSTLTIPRDKTDKVNPFMNRDVFSQKWDTKIATIFATPT